MDSEIDSTNHSETSDSNRKTSSEPVYESTAESNTNADPNESPAVVVIGTRNCGKSELIRTFFRGSSSQIRHSISSTNHAKYIEKTYVESLNFLGNNACSKTLPLIVYEIPDDSESLEWMQKRESENDEENVIPSYEINSEKIESSTIHSIFDKNHPDFLFHGNRKVVILFMFSTDMLRADDNNQERVLRAGCLLEYLYSKLIELSIKNEKSNVVENCVLQLLWHKVDSPNDNSPGRIQECTKAINDHFQSALIPNAEIKIIKQLQAEGSVVEQSQISNVKILIRKF